MYVLIMLPRTGCESPGCTPTSPSLHSALRSHQLLGCLQLENFSHKQSAKILLVMFEKRQQKSFWIRLKGQEMFP